MIANSEQWVTRIMPWDFAQECPSKKAFAARKLQRLAAILSLENVGMCALKHHVEPALAKKACEDSQEKRKNFVLGDMDQHKARYGDDNPEGWKLLKQREDELKDDYGKAMDRLQLCEEEVLAKKQRVV